MRSTRFLKLTSALIASVAILGSYQKLASARTMHASAGSSSSGTDHQNFTVQFGVGRTAPGPGVWRVPLPFDFPGARTITVRGGVSGNGSLTCQAVALNTAGVVVSSSQTVLFPVTGTVTSITLSLANVPGGAYGLLSCEFGGNAGEAALLGADYPA